MSEFRSAASSIPVIDVSALREGREIPKALVMEIDKACREIGFFTIINHGIDAAVIDEVLAQTRAFFDLPQDLKDSVEIHKSPYMRGYFNQGADKSDGILGDVKEGFDMASDLSRDDPYVQAGLPFYGPNAWPEFQPSFKPVMLDYHAQALALGQNLLKVFALALEMPEDYFHDKFVKPMAQLRVLRYPPTPHREGQAIGAGEHTDFGWITMIAQDGAGGLEVKNAAGEWIAVTPIESALVVNVGDLMSLWTNDRYTATIHRVLNNGNQVRYSAAFFMDPDYKAKVTCLPSCISHDNPRKYEPIVAGEYMDRRFLETTTFRDTQEPHRSNEHA
ncbi:isopenicillin N synthase family dioxygenase [Pseudomonas japonica]|uniref:2-oxoglutarate-dependent ethylene/succinate-forming enzyme n=1 Tax=Pseudomonas japonica TaxID=256466 RepID=A0A239BCV0_9PSED|nr:2-oxoglutarate and iron-dependent oxygenase domain-containing protein [Pseudomonas japonica]SNS05770.1 Isopenicillin N synthase [Pseudomonas japonica]